MEVRLLPDGRGRLPRWRGEGAHLHPATSAGPPACASTSIGRDPGSYPGGQGSIPWGHTTRRGWPPHHAAVAQRQSTGPSSRGPRGQHPPVAPPARSSMEEHLATNQEVCRFDPDRAVEGAGSGSREARVKLPEDVGPRSSSGRNRASPAPHLLASGSGPGLPKPGCGCSTRPEGTTPEKLTRKSAASVRRRLWVRSPPSAPTPRRWIRRLAS